MTRLADLISPALVATLTAAVANNTPEPDEDEVRVTTINGVEYDVRSGAMVDTTCADCPERLLVEVAPDPDPRWRGTRQQWLDLLCSRDRVSVCMPCGQKRTAGQKGIVIHTNTKENTPVPTPEQVVDLTKFSPAELAQLAVEAREHMLREKAEVLPEKRKKAKKKEAKRLAKDEAGKREQRAERKGMVHPDLTIVVKGQTRFIPALDLSDEGLDLNIATNPKQRTPYNKALYALGEDLLSKDTTLAQLAEAHRALEEHAGPPAATIEEPKKKGKKKAKVERLAAQIDPDAAAKGKVEAFARVTGKSFEDAAVHLVAAGVI